MTDRCARAASSTGTAPPTSRRRSGRRNAQLPISNLPRHSQLPTPNQRGWKLEVGSALVVGSWKLAVRANASGYRPVRSRRIVSELGPRCSTWSAANAAIASSRGTMIVGRCSEFSAAGSPVSTMRRPPPPGVDAVQRQLDVARPAARGSPASRSGRRSSRRAPRWRTAPSMPDVGRPAIVTGSTVVPLCCPNSCCT